MYRFYNYVPFWVLCTVLSIRYCFEDNGHFEYYLSFWVLLTVLSTKIVLNICTVLSIKNCFEDNGRFLVLCTVFSIMYRFEYYVLF